MKKITTRFMLCTLAMSFAMGGQTVHAGEATNQQIQMAELHLQRDEIKNELIRISVQMEAIEDIEGDTLIGKYRNHAIEFHALLTAASIAGYYGAAYVGVKKMFSAKQRFSFMIGSLVSAISNTLIMGVTTLSDYADYPMYRDKFESMPSDEREKHYQTLIEASKADVAELVAIEKELKKSR